MNGSSVKLLNVLSYKYSLTFDYYVFLYCIEGYGDLFTTYDVYVKLILFLIKVGSIHVVFFYITRSKVISNLVLATSYLKLRSKHDLNN